MAAAGGEGRWRTVDDAVAGIAGRQRFADTQEGVSRHRGPQGCAGLRQPRRGVGTAGNTQRRPCQSLCGIVAASGPVIGASVGLCTGKW